MGWAQALAFRLASVKHSETSYSLLVKGLLEAAAAPSSFSKRLISSLIEAVVVSAFSTLAFSSANSVC